MSKRHFVGGSLVSGVLLGAILLAPLAVPGMADDKPAKPSAKVLAGEWRYPDAKYASVTPTDSEAMCMEWTTVEAEYGDVLNYYAKRCGHEKLQGDAFSLMTPIGKDKGGYNMIVGHREACDFGRNTDRGTVHVAIRQLEKKRIEIRTVVGVR